MSFSDEYSPDTNSSIRKGLSPQIYTVTKRKMYVPKFRQTWLKMFEPWLTTDPDNSSKPYCKVCKCRLHCNTNHLNRHSRTVKHKAHFEVAVKGGDLIELKHKLTIRKQTELTEEVVSQKKTKTMKTSNVNIDAIQKIDPNLEFETKFNSSTESNDQQGFQDFQFVPTEFEFGNDNHIDLGSENIAANQTDIESVVVVNAKEETYSYRASLLDKIKKDRNELFDSYAAVVSQKSQKIEVEATPVKEKDHVDLYFDSVSASVKRLTPKLIAEAKLRVSRLLGELELRHICANENEIGRPTIDSPSNTHTNPSGSVTTTSPYYNINHPTVLRMGNENGNSQDTSQS